MKAAETLSHIRHLACLGLGSEVAVPAMLDLLEALVPSANHSFVWTDPNATITNVHVRHPSPPALDVLLHHSSRLEAEFSFEMQARSRLRTGFFDQFCAATHYEATVAYNEVLKPHGMGQACDLILRDGAGPRGVAMIGRALGDAPFSLGERNIILTLQPWLLHALSRPAAEVAAMADDPGIELGEEAVLLCDGAGQVLRMGPEAARMVLYAGNGRISPGATLAGLGDLLPQAVRRVCTNLAAVLSGRSALPPQATIKTAWGTFHFRAHALANGAEAVGTDALMVVTIRRAVPLALRLHGRVALLPLTARQRQIALLIGLGKRPEAIQSELDLGAGAYRRHLEDIHARLAVGNRAELMAMLHAPSAAAAASRVAAPGRRSVA